MTHPCPLVFACAGCSLAGRLAYDAAQEFDRRQAAEMSCLAGVAAELPFFLRKLEDREVWVIDGCPLECAANVFRKQGREFDVHLKLHDFGVKKNGQPSGDGDIAALADQLEQQVMASRR